MKRVITDLSAIFGVKEEELPLSVLMKEEPSRALKDFMLTLRDRVNYLRDRLQMTSENKELLQRDRDSLEQKVKELNHLLNNLNLKNSLLTE